MDAKGNKKLGLVAYVLSGLKKWSKKHAEKKEGKDDLKPIDLTSGDADL